MIEEKSNWNFSLDSLQLLKIFLSFSQPFFLPSKIDICCKIKEILYSIIHSKILKYINNCKIYIISYSQDCLLLKLNRDQISYIYPKIHSPIYSAMNLLKSTTQIGKSLFFLLFPSQPFPYPNILNIEKTFVFLSINI